MMCGVLVTLSAHARDGYSILSFSQKQLIFGLEKARSSPCEQYINLNCISVSVHA